jgi:iron complex outermembrane receptor protein
MPGKLTSKGFEIEAAATPLKGLQVDYSFGYTDAEYTELKVSQNGSAVDLKGKKQIFTPNYTSMLALQYGYAIGAKKSSAFGGKRRMEAYRETIF